MSAADVEAGRGRLRNPAATAGGAWLFLRRLRFEPGPPLAMLLVLGATCLLFAAVPRLSNAVADDGLRHNIAHAPTEARNARTLEVGRIPAAAGADPLARVAARAAGAEQALPAPIRQLVGDRAFVGRSVLYTFPPDAQPEKRAVPRVNGLDRFLSLRVQNGVEEHIRVRAGRLPRPSRTRVRARLDQALGSNILNPFGTGTGIAGPRLTRTVTVPLVEVALSRMTARLLRARVGNRMIFAPEPRSAAPFGSATAEWRPLVVEVVGLFDAKDPRAPYWFGDESLYRTETEQTPDLERLLVFAQGLISAEQYRTVMSATRPIPLTYEYRHFIDAERADAGGVRELSNAVDRIDATYAGAGPLDRRVEVGLSPVLDRYRRARSQAETMLALAAIGLLACALATIALLGALSYDRRRRETGVSRARGASPVQVLAAQGAEGLLIAVPAAVLGWTIATVAVDSRPAGLSAWLAIAIAAAAVAILLGAIFGIARRPLGPQDRQDVSTGPSPRRLAHAAFVADAAVDGVYLLRRRGLQPSDAAGGFDPYLAGAPVLLGLACGVVALRLYPLPVAAAARLGRRTRGLALHLGLSRAARQSGVGSAPLLALVLALGIACFAAAMARTLESAQNRSAWTAVGADVRVDSDAGQPLPDRLVARLSELGVVAPAYVQDAGLGEEGDTTLFLALDVPAYERLVRGTPAELRLPAAALQGSGLPGSVATVTSTDWPRGFFQHAFEGGTVSFVGAAQRSRFPGIPAGVPFSIAPLGAVQRETANSVRPNRLYIRGASTAAVREAVADAAPRAQIYSRDEVVGRLRASPLVSNVLRGFRAAIVLAALYAAVAVLLMALIAARSRSRDLALVRTIGASPRDALVLPAVELAPFVLAALAAGIGLGLAIPHLMAPALDLRFFTGGGDASIVTPWPAAAALGAGLVALVAITVAVVGVRARRAGLDRVLRIGER